MSRAGLWCVVLIVAACRIDFDPTTPRDPGGEPDAPSTAVDAPVSTPDAVDAPGAGATCRMRIATTDNQYLPIAQCTMELGAARTACNTDPSCILLGSYWYPASTGVNDTGACADGGDGMTGCRQWFCAERTTYSPPLSPSVGDPIEI